MRVRDPFPKAVAPLLEIGKRCAVASAYVTPSQSTTNDNTPHQGTLGRLRFVFLASDSETGPCWLYHSEPFPCGSLLFAREIRECVPLPLVWPRRWQPRSSIGERGFVHPPLPPGVIPNSPQLPLYERVSENTGISGFYERVSQITGILGKKRNLCTGVHRLTCSGLGSRPHNT